MAYPVSLFPIAVASSDFDQDGVRDLVISGRWDEELTVLRGAGDGTFGPPLFVPTEGIPTSVATADFNGDGRGDIVATMPVLDRLVVFLTQANGTPGPPHYLGAGDSPGGVLAADIDVDGKADIVATNYLSDTLSIWRGHGDGTFASPVSLPSGPRPYAAIATLLDGDLRPDLVVANATNEYMGGGTVSVLIGTGAGGFAGPVSYHVPGGATRNLAAADLDDDGDVDVFFGSFDNSEEANTVGYLPGRGDGTLGSAEAIETTGDGDLAFGVADFDHDGHPDLAFGAHHGPTCCSSRGGRILLGRGDGTFEQVSRFQSGLGVTALLVDDFDRDGRSDVAATSDFLWHQVSVNLGRGDGRMGADPQPIDAGFFPSAIDVGDVDGDPWPDVVIARDGQVRIVRGSGSGSFAPAVVHPTAPSIGRMVLADLTGDRLDDVTVYDFDFVSYLRSVGAGAVAAPLRLLEGLFIRKLAAGDVTGDGVADLVALSTGAQTEVVVVSRPGEAGGFTVTIPIVLEHPWSLATGDVDGDGTGDIVVKGAGLVSIRGLGAGQFGPPSYQPGGDEGEGSLKAADLNGDGRADVVVTEGENARLYLGRADGTLEPSFSFRHHATPLDVYLADFDADGRLDIATLDRLGPDDRHDLSIVVNPLSNPGAVTRRVIFEASFFAAAAVGDADADGRVDLLPGRDALGVALIRNQGPFPNRAPRAQPAAEHQLECAGPDGTPVTLDGRGSTDPDSTTPQQEDLAGFEWFEDFGTPAERLVAGGALAEVTLPLGTHVLTLRVTDRAGATDTAEFLVEVVDTTAPVAGASVSPARLWPPNHRYTTVRADLIATDTCGPVSVTLVSAQSSEPDDLLGGADGATRDDIAGAMLGTRDLEVFLRAERNGLGAGRTYTLTWRIEDASGNAIETSAQVLVPFSTVDRGSGAGTPPGNGSSGGGSGSGGTSGRQGRSHGPRPRPSGRF